MNELYQNCQHYLYFNRNIMCARRIEIMDKIIMSRSFFPLKKESCNCAAWEAHPKGLGNSAVFQHLMVIMFAQSVWFLRMKQRFSINSFVFLCYSCCVKVAHFQSRFWISIAKFFHQLFIILTMDICFILFGYLCALLSMVNSWNSSVYQLASTGTWLL